jgi:hypothetical protein
MKKSPCLLTKVVLPLTSKLSCFPRSCPTCRVHTTNYKRCLVIVLSNKLSYLSSCIICKVFFPRSCPISNLSYLSSCLIFRVVLSSDAAMSPSKKPTNLSQSGEIPKAQRRVEEQIMKRSFSKFHLPEGRHFFNSNIDIYYLKIYINCKSCLVIFLVYYGLLVCELGR